MGKNHNKNQETQSRSKSASDMKNSSPIKKFCLTDIIVLSIALVCLVLAVALFPYKHYFNDYRNTSYYYDSSYIRTDSFSLPDKYVYIKGDDSICFCGENSVDPSIIKYSTISDNQYKLQRKKNNVDSSVIKTLITIFHHSNDSIVKSNPDSFLTMVIDSLKNIPSGGVYYCEKDSSNFVWSFYHEYPHYSFNKNILDSILRLDNAVLDSIWNIYDNVYDFLMAEKVLSQVTFGYADVTNKRLMIDDSTVVNVDSVKGALHKQFYDSLCKNPGYVIYNDSIKRIKSLREADDEFVWCNINNISMLKEKELDNDNSNIWMLFLALFLYSFLVMSLYRITNGKDANKAKRGTANSQNAASDEKLLSLKDSIDRMMDELNRMKSFIGSDNYGSSNVVDNDTYRMYKSYEDLYNKVRNFYDEDTSVEQCSKYVTERLEFLSNILKCKDGDDLIELFKKQDDKTPEIITPNTICASAKSDFEKFQSFANKVKDKKTRDSLNKLLDEYKVCQSVSETLGRDRNTDSKTFLAEVKKIKSGYDDYLSVQKQFKLRRQSFEISWIDQFKAHCNKFNISSKGASDFVEFVIGLTGDDHTSVLAKVKDTQTALSNYREFLSDYREFLSDKDKAFDGRQLHEFVWTLYDKHARNFAAVVDRQSMFSDENANTFKSHLDAAVGCYDLCKSLHESFNKGNDTLQLKNSDPVIGDYCETLSSIYTSAMRFKDSEEFVNLLYDSFVKNFIDHRKTNTDMGWFFEHVLAIAFHTSDFIEHFREPKKKITYFQNYDWLKHGLSGNPGKKEYIYKDAYNSTKYSDQISEWLKEVKVKHTKFLVDGYLIKP